MLMYLLKKFQFLCHKESADTLLVEQELLGWRGGGGGGGLLSLQLLKLLVPTPKLDNFMEPMQMIQKKNQIFFL